MDPSGPFIGGALRGEPESSLPLRVIAPWHFERHVMVEGYATKLTPAGFEMSLSLPQSPTDVIVEMKRGPGAIVEEGWHVIVGGILRTRKCGRAFACEPVMIADHVEHLETGPEAEEPRPEFRNPLLSSWFTEERVKGLTCTTSDEMISLLQGHALAEGFRLVCRTTRESSWNRLQCFHRAVNHPEQPDCPFSIRIQVRLKEKRKTDSGRVCVVTLFTLKHDHARNPLIFAHLCLSDENRRLIRALGEMHATPEKVAAYLMRERRVELSSYQISVLMRQSPTDVRKSETEHLAEFMESVHGLYFMQEREEQGQLIRSGMATFTTEELTNLSTYGDVVAIDPTFVPLNLNWSVIPLTVVGKSREIHCAGLVLCARTTADTFHWILNLLTHHLPCATILRTIISDDDQALDSAFAMTEDETIRGLGRVVCFWHKLQAFKLIAARLRHPELTLVFQSMGMTRDQSECRACLDELLGTGLPEIRNFIEESVEPKLQLITKSFNRAFSCGYVTSSIAEAMNAGIKSSISGKNMTLMEIREIFSERERMMNTNREYLRERPHKPGRSATLEPLISDLRVSEAIAAGIAHSLDKASKLRVSEDGELLFRVRQSRWDRDDTVFFVGRTGRDCSCAKVETTGLPCSHICAVLQRLEAIDQLSSFVHPRWRLDDVQMERCRREMPNEPYMLPEELRSQGLSTRQRYTSLMSEAATVAAAACRTQRNYEDFRQTLTTFGQGIMRALPDANDHVIEVGGTRPGRPTRTRIGKLPDAPRTIPCPICGESHRVKRCPSRPAVLACRLEEDGRAGGRRLCPVCELRGHNTSTCPALRRYKQGRGGEAGGERDATAVLPGPNSRSEDSEREDSEEGGDHARFRRGSDSGDDGEREREDDRRHGRSDSE